MNFLGLFIKFGLANGEFMMQNHSFFQYINLILAIVVMGSMMHS